jgi:hypothetical protein
VALITSGDHCLTGGEPGQHAGATRAHGARVGGSPCKVGSDILGGPVVEGGDGFQLGSAANGHRRLRGKNCYGFQGRSNETALRRRINRCRGGRSLTVTAADSRSGSRLGNGASGVACVHH